MHTHLTLFRSRARMSLLAECLRACVLVRRPAVCVRAWKLSFAVFGPVVFGPLPGSVGPSRCAGTVLPLAASTPPSSSASPPSLPTASIPSGQRWCWCWWCHRQQRHAACSRCSFALCFLLSGHVPGFGFFLLFYHHTPIK